MSVQWSKVRLADVLRERSEIPRQEDLALGRVRVVAKIGFNDGRIEYRPDCKTKTGMILVRPGDLLVSGINAVKGAIAVYGVQNDAPIAATIHYSAYEINSERADGQYLLLFMRSVAFRDILLEAVPGGIKTELKARRLLPIEIPLPTLSEQRRIVIRIEELATKTDEARSLRQQALNEAERLMGKTVEHIFTEQKDGPWVDGYLSDYVVETYYGTSEKTNDEPVGIPVLRMGNIQKGIIDTGDLKYLSIADKDRHKWILQPYDILVNRTNSSDLVGKCAVFNLDGDWGFASYLIRLRLDLDRAEPTLVAHYINSPIGRNYMFSERKQMTGQANINAQKLKALPISLPCLPKQRQITAYLDELRSRIDRLRALQVGTAAELDALLPSILDRAFKGEL